MPTYPLLGAAIDNKKSIVIMGGESSSQITQALDLVPGRLYIKKNNAMNDIHEKQVDTIIKANRGAKLLNDETDLTIDNIDVKYLSDAEKVAEEIIKENYFFNEEARLHENKDLEVSYDQNSTTKDSVKKKIFKFSVMLKKL